MEAITEFLKISYGYGSGDGSGYGSGSGDGSGDGYGYGYGDGLKKFNTHTVHQIDNTPTIIYYVKGQVAKGAIIKNDLTLQDCYVAKVGNFFAHGSTIEKAISEAQEKYNENRPLEDRIADFVLHFNNTDKYPASEFYKWHTILTGSCSFGKDNFVQQNGIDLNGEMTASEFINLTKNAYGSDAIKQLAESYK